MLSLLPSQTSLTDGDFEGGSIALLTRGYDEENVSHESEYIDENTVRWTCSSCEG